MKIAVVGGGMLGLTLAYRLAQRQHQVTIFESAEEIGGLAAPANYGEFRWDRFYHCILPQDRSLLSLIADIGLQSEIRWKTTKTGYFARGRFYDMSSTTDFLRFPLLSFIDKGRLGLLIQYARWLANPQELYGITAQDWLIRWCGRRAYQRFWQPLLKSKFGSLHDQIAATFIWATVTRLFGARQGGSKREQLGYVRGGYRRILAVLETKLRELDVRVLLSARVDRIETARQRDGTELGKVSYESMTSSPTEHKQGYFDQVFFTGPTPLARTIVSVDSTTHVEQMLRDYPTSSAYLGIACTILVLAKSLMPYYVLNIGDDPSAITGVVEMTNLVDRYKECNGRSLVYIPRYAASGDKILDDSDDEVFENVLKMGLRPIFSQINELEIVGRFVHRARFVQALPLAGDRVEPSVKLPRLASPFQILNSSMLQCATLNNNEIVNLVDAYLEVHGESLNAAGSKVTDAHSSRELSDVIG